MSNYTSADSVPLVAHKTGVTQGRALERHLIVAWLRDRKEMSDFYLDHSAAREIAMYIEAGDHLE